MFFVWMACSSPSHSGDQAFSTEARPQDPIYTPEDAENIIEGILSGGIPHPLRVLELYEYFMTQRSAD